MASADTCELITSYTTSAEGGASVTAKAIYRKVTQLEANGAPMQLNFLCVLVVFFQTTYTNALLTITNENGTITTDFIDQPIQRIEGFDYNNFSIRLKYYDGFEYLYKELSYDEYPYKDSQHLVSSGGVYTELDKKLTKSLSDVSSTTNVATTDNMLINKAGTMYKVTIQELQEVFGSANYKGNFVSVSALPATGTAGDYAFVKVVTDGDTDLIMYIWNDTDKHWEETGTSQYVKNATFQATMGGVDEALQNVKVETDSTPTQNSTNAVQSGGVFTALQEKQGQISITENDDGSVDINIPDAGEVSTGGVTVIDVSTITETNENGEKFIDLSKNGTYILKGTPQEIIEVYFGYSKINPDYGKLANPTTGYLDTLFVGDYRFGKPGYSSVGRLHSSTAPILALIKVFDDYVEIYTTTYSF
jgi:hypothetical protein